MMPNPNQIHIIVLIPFLFNIVKFGSLLICKFFFLETNDYSITQAWVGLDTHTGIEQPIKQRDLWKERAFLAIESVISFCAL